MLPAELLSEKCLIKFALRLVLRTNLKCKSSVSAPRRTKTEHGTYSDIFWRRRELGYIPNRLREDMGIHPFCPHIYLKFIFIPGWVAVLFLPSSHYAAEKRNTLPTCLVSLACLYLMETNTNFFSLTCGGASIFLETSKESPLGAPSFGTSSFVPFWSLLSFRVFCRTVPSVPVRRSICIVNGSIMVAPSRGGIPRLFTPKDWSSPGSTSTEVDLAGDPFDSVELPPLVAKTKSDCRQHPNQSQPS